MLGTKIFEHGHEFIEFGEHRDSHAHRTHNLGSMSLHIRVCRNSVWARVEAFVAAKAEQRTDISLLKDVLKEKPTNRRRWERFHRGPRLLNELDIFLGQ